MSILSDLLVEEFGEILSERIARFLSSEDILKQMHITIEDFLIELRDLRISVLSPANGFVVKEADGISNHCMRVGTKDGLRIIMNEFIKVQSNKN